MAVMLFAGVVTRMVCNCAARVACARITQSVIAYPQSVIGSVRIVWRWRMQ